MNTNTLDQLQQLLSSLPHGATYTAGFNIYHLLIGAGGGAATWHLILQNMPKLQDYCDSRTGGAIVVLFRFLVGSPKQPVQPQPAATAAIIKP